MPREISPEAKWSESISVPRDGEGIDASDVALPMGDLLGNDKHLRGMFIELGRQVEELQAAQGGFNLFAPTGQVAEPGRSYEIKVNIGRLDGFDEAVDMNVTGLPVGVSESWSADPVTGNETVLTLALNGTALAGIYNLNIRGQSATRSAAIPFQLTVAEQSLPPRFDFSLAQNMLTLNKGNQSSLPIVVTRQGGFSDNIQFSLDTPISGLSHEFQPNTVTGGSAKQDKATTLNLTNTSILSGTYNLTVRAVSGSQVVTRSLAILVEAAAQAGEPDFSLRVVCDTNDALTNTAATIHIDRTGGYTGPVTLYTGPVSSSWPDVLINGTPGEQRIVVNGNTARLTVEGLSAGWKNSGVVCGVNTPLSSEEWGAYAIFGTASEHGGPSGKRHGSFAVRKGTKIY